MKKDIRDNDYLSLFSYIQFVGLLSIMLDRFLNEDKDCSEEQAKKFVEQVKYNLSEYEKFIKQRENIIKKVKI